MQSNEAALEYFRREQAALHDLVRVHENDHSVCRIVEVLRKLIISLRATRALGKDIGSKELVKEASDALKDVTRQLQLYGNPDECKTDCCDDELSDATTGFVATCLETRRRVREELRAASEAMRELDFTCLANAGRKIHEALKAYEKDGDDEINQDAVTAIRKFVTVLEESRSTTEGHAVLYQCCDAIRAALRKDGIEVSD